MKVFISWSGERSYYVAKVLHDWLPNVIQAVKPWMSSEDISSGTRWSSAISQELEKTRVGIICLTPENQHKPWVMFESGAISKTLSETYVCPYLIDLDPTQVDTPLNLFQSNKANKEGTFKILQTLNGALADFDSNSAPVKNLDEIFEVWWSRLNEKLTNLPILEKTQIEVRPVNDILDEILKNTREQLRRENIRTTNANKKDEYIDEFIKLLDLISSGSYKSETFKPLSLSNFGSFKRSTTPIIRPIKNLSALTKQENQEILNSKQENESEDNKANGQILDEEV